MCANILGVPSMCYHKTSFFFFDFCSSSRFPFVGTLTHGQLKCDTRPQGREVLQAAKIFRLHSQVIKELLRVGSQVWLGSTTVVKRKNFWGQIEILTHLSRTNSMLTVILSICMFYTLNANILIPLMLHIIHWNEGCMNFIISALFTSSIIKTKVFCTHRKFPSTWVNRL